MKKTPEQRGEELVTWMKNNNDRLIREVIQKPIGATTLKLLESGQEISLQSLIQLLQSDLDSQPRGSSTEATYRKALDHLRSIAG